MFCVNLLVCLAAVGVAVAVPFQERNVCTAVGTATTDTFDGVTVSPALPDVNGIIGPKPTGAYLTYNNMAYANVGTMSNVIPPSTPNDIYMAGSQNNAYLTPTFKGANAFKLSQIRYACIYMTGATAFEVPPKCTFEVSCTVAGGGSRSKTFTFVPDSPLKTSFNTGTFSADFTGLTRCDIRLKSVSVAGLVDSAAAVPLTILAIDNVANQGQKCQ